MSPLLLLQHPYATTAARWILGLVFLIAAVRKLPNQRHFIFVVLAYRVLPRRVAYVYASLLPWIEAVVGVMLLLGAATQVGAALGGLLLLSFTAALALNVARGRTGLDCGCFGTGRKQGIGGKVLARNGVLLLLSVQVLAFATPYLAVDGLLAASVQSNWGMPILRSISVIALASAILALSLPLLKQAGGLRRASK